MKSGNFDDFIQRDLKREMAYYERLQSKQPSPKPPAPEPTIHFLDQVPDKPLTWLWPGRIPFGHLTLLDAAPGSVLSLFALSLAACISRGSPLPDGTLTRSLRQAPLDPFHAPAPSSPLLLAARSHLLLAPDPADHSHQPLLTIKHSLGIQPVTLAYTIVASEAGIPTIHWLGEGDHGQLTRLCTGPLRSPYRQAILRFLQQSDAPQTIPTILEATSYDREAGRKMLVRLNQAGELVSPARGLYTTAHHPCLLHLSNETAPVSNVPNAPSASIVPSSPHHPPAHSPQSEAPPAPAIPVPDPPSSAIPSGSNVSSVASLRSPPYPSPQNDSSSVSYVPNVSTVSSLSPPPPPAHTVKLASLLRGQFQRRSGQILLQLRESTDPQDHTTNDWLCTQPGQRNSSNPHLDKQFEIVLLLGYISIENQERKYSSWKHSKLFALSWQYAASKIHQSLNPSSGKLLKRAV